MDYRIQGNYLRMGEQIALTGSFTVDREGKLAGAIYDCSSTVPWQLISGIMRREPRNLALAFRRFTPNSRRDPIYLLHKPHDGRAEGDYQGFWMMTPGFERHSPTEQQILGLEWILDYDRVKYRAWRHGPAHRSAYRADLRIAKL